MEIDNGGCAFPVPGPATTGNGDLIYSDPGMSLRDYFAAAAIPVAHERLREYFGEIPSSAAWAEECYCIADEMLAERSKKGEK